MTVNIHATCIRIGRSGVLLLGKSGAGKSDLALRLIARGAVLVSDDRCDLSVTRDKLVARAPRQIAGLLEVRGIGIVEMSHAPSASIALVVDLSLSVERLPKPQTYGPPKPLTLPPSARPPRIALNAFEASTPDKIFLAVHAPRLITSRRAVKRN